MPLSIFRRLQLVTYKRLNSSLSVNGDHSLPTDGKPKEPKKRINERNKFSELHALETINLKKNEPIVSTGEAYHEQCPV